MAGVSVASWVVVRAVGGDDAHPEVLFGMLAPLAGALASWIVYDRVHRRQPERLTTVMVGGLALKMALFGAYVVGMVQVAGLRPVPLVVSFGGYFIALHAMEAFFLRQMLMRDMIVSDERHA